ncbi:hypothetical protein ACH5RR_029628 [Cinchona calisaya]|uniref:Uncharacterized protein n=1 Tax=Cinchona calisaya TaxID=153742 RepID=A0ABD2YWL7_9GENT
MAYSTNFAGIKGISLIKWVLQKVYQGICAVDPQDGKGDTDTHSVQEFIQDSESDEVVSKEEMDNHSFEDCTSDEGSQRQGRSLDRNAMRANALENREESLSSSSGFLDESHNAKPKTVGAGSRGKLEDGENMPDREGTTVQKKIERQGSQPKLATDTGKQKSETAVISTSKKQPVSGTKPATEAIGTKSRLKQQDLPGTQLRQAKPNAVSRWIPPNKGSYFNSMHVSYPPSR